NRARPTCRKSGRARLARSARARKARDAGHPANEARQTSGRTLADSPGAERERFEWVWNRALGSADERIAAQGVIIALRRMRNKGPALVPRGRGNAVGAWLAIQRFAGDRPDESSSLGSVPTTSLKSISSPRRETRMLTESPGFISASLRLK